MRIDDIDALLATVQFSSLNQAADYLGITQSAITRRLQRLEQELNVTLLERQTRPLTLTAAGLFGFFHYIGVGPNKAEDDEEDKPAGKNDDGENKA